MPSSAALCCDALGIQEVCNLLWGLSRPSVAMDKCDRLSYVPRVGPDSGDSAKCREIDRIRLHPVSLSKCKTPIAPIQRFSCASWKSREGFSLSKSKKFSPIKIEAV